MSRGLLFAMSARTRRGLVLVWTALFMCSLLMQYAALSSPAPVLAAHNEGIFELEGDADDSGAAGADWAGGAEGSIDQFFVGASAETAANDVTYFTGGGSKDENDIPDWAITDNSVPDKDELLDAYAAVYQVGGDTWVYFGADRFDNDGTAQIGFWFFQDEVGISGGDFTGEHVDGDVLVLSEYTNGGVVSLICAYEWDGDGGGSNIAGAGDCDPATNGSNLNLVAAGSACDVADGSFDICAVTNADVENAPWPFTNKDGENDFDPGQFFEGGINLSDMFGGEPPCFGSFLAETRSSAETDAQLKDFAFGSLDTCRPPVIETQVSASTINVGESVTDTADLSGNSPVPTGTIAFYVCGPSQSAAGCDSTANKVGATKTLDDGVAVSDAFTPDTAGTYCFLAVYTPDEAGSNHYRAGSHTNSTTECFRVLPAQVEIDKTPDDATADAGDDISFTITFGNTGEGSASGVEITDPLPAGDGLDWSITGSTGQGSECVIEGSVGNETLVCELGTLAAGEEGSVTVTSGTTEADCGVIDNTASIDSTNDGEDADDGDITVVCPPDIAVVKVAVPDDAVNAGDQIRFQVTISNNGTGVAVDATASDTLPAGIAWAIEGAADGFSIVGGVLTWGPDDLDPGESHTVTIVGTTDAADCGTVTNTATVDAANEPAEDTGDNSDTADVVVECPDVAVEKTADAGTINAGEDASFTIRITNVGQGTAYDVSLSDTLPGGVAWNLDLITIDGQTADPALCSIAGTALTCANLGDLEPGDEIRIHISGDTGLEDCGELVNTVTIDAVNESNAPAVTANNSDSATVVVDCPDLGIDKDADHAGPVVIGSQIGFTVTIQNSGDGTAFGVTVSDTLDPDFSWSIQSETGQPDWTLSGNTLSFAGDLPAGTGSSVHVVANTTVGNAAQCGVVPNTAVLDHSSIDPTPASASETVRCPDTTIEKETPETDVLVGQTVGFTIEVGVVNGPVTNAVVTDVLPVGQDYVAGSQSSVPAATSFAVSPDGRTLTWTYASLPTGATAATITYDVTIAAGASGELENEATVCADAVATCKSAVEIVVPRNPTLVIDKENDAPLVNLGGGVVLPTAEEGETITFTLSYDLEDGPVTNGIIVDLLPEGIDYITGTASSNAEFTFAGYDADLHALVWEADEVTTDGTLTYQGFPVAGASELEQPLINVVTIDSDQTPPDDGESPVFVPEPPAGATATPRITLPPTDSFGSGTSQSNPGFGLMVTLLFIAGLALVVGIITPAPERVRRQTRR